MKLVHNDPYSTHQRVLLALPWYVNKTLHGAELLQVEAHLKVCLTCKREVLNLQNLALMVQQTGILDAAEQAAFAQLKKRLHQPQPSESVSSSPVATAMEAPKQIKRMSLRVWSISRPALAMAAMLMLALLVPSYFKLNQLLGSDYRTLSDGGQATLNRNEIHLVFSDKTTVQQMTSLLTPLSGEIVGQPTPQGVYTVRFAEQHTQEELLAQLRKNPQVIFAEPASVVLSTPSNERVPK
ncbi:MAG: hypothetical protein ABL903_13700 [Methylococcales bacterium]